MKSFYAFGLNVSQLLYNKYINNHNTRGADLLQYHWHGLNVFRKMPSKVGVNLVIEVPDFIKVEGNF